MVAVGSMVKVKRAETEREAEGELERVAAGVCAEAEGLREALLTLARPEALEEAVAAADRVEL